MINPPDIFFANVVALDLTGGLMPDHGPSAGWMLLGLSYRQSRVQGILLPCFLRLLYLSDFPSVNF